MMWRQSQGFSACVHTEEWWGQIQWRTAKQSHHAYLNTDYRTKPVSVCIHKYRNGKLEFEYGCVCMCMPNLADEQTGLEIISWARVKRPGWHSQRKTGLGLSQHTVLQKDVTTKLPWIISITAVSHMQPRSIQGQEGEMIRHLNLADF